MRTREEAIAVIRRFNRRYVSVMRLLDRNYLKTGSSALEVAVLIEIGQDDGVSACRLSRLLNMDKGHLSRTIRRFEERGLVARSISGDDARMHELFLTEGGRAYVAELSESGADVVSDAFSGAGESGLLQAAEAMSVILEILEQGGVECESSNTRQSEGKTS